MSLLVWLPLNGNLDNLGVSPAKFRMVNSSGGLTTATPGKPAASCYRRATKNTADYITSDINFTLSGDVSMACWCKITDYGTNNSANGIITQHGHQTGGLGITMRYIGANDYRMSVNSGLYGDAGGGTNDRTYQTYYGNTNIYNAWHHLCVVYEASKKQIRLYVDGKLDRDPVNVAGNNATARPFRLFDWSTDHSSSASYRPPCYLNDVRLYDHLLSSKEIKLLSQGLVAHYKLDCGGNTNLLPNSHSFSGTGGNGAITLDPNGWYKKSYTHPAGSSSYDDFCSWGGVVTVNANEVYTASFLARSNDSTGNFVVYFYNNSSGVQVSRITSSQGHDKGGTDGNCTLKLTNTWQRYWITWQFNGTTTPLAKTLLFRILNTGGNVEIAQVKLERGNKATPYGLRESEAGILIGDDCSGWNNQGHDSGPFKYSSDTPRNTAGVLLDSNNYITNVRNMDGTNATISLWVKLNTYPASHAIILADHNTKIAFGFYNSQDMIISCSESSSVYVQNLKSKLTTGVWHHLAITKQNTKYLFYLDGKEWASSGNAYTSATNYWTHTPVNELLINGRHNGASRDYPFNGYLSDVRIYCSALSAEDIENLYVSAGSIVRTGGLLAHTLNETPNITSKINRSGVFTASRLSERSALQEMQTTILPDGSSWARIFYHKNHGGTVLFTSYAEIMNCNTADKYSRLSLLPDLKATDGKYELMLTYPEKHPGQYNRWKQSYPPQSTWMGNSDGNAKVTGYEAIHIDWTSSYWGGLGRQHEGTQTISSTFIDGSIGHGNWFYAIGATGAHDGGIPGPSSGVQETELWVRVDTLPKNTKMQIVKEKFVASTLLQEI